VTPAGLERLEPRIRVVARDVVSARNPLRHDSEQLAAVLLELARAAWPPARAPRLPLEVPSATPMERALVAAGAAKE
jgi:hypothetical protein